MDPIKLTFNADHDLLLKVGIDPSTSEGKAKIIEVLLAGLDEYKPHAILDYEMAVIQALTAEV